MPMVAMKAGEMAFQTAVETVAKMVDTSVVRLGYL
jgi:hypothetical protein